MKSDELLKIIGEAQERYVLSALDSRDGIKESRRRISLRHWLLIAAVIALMLVLMGSAVAVMRLQHLTIRDDSGDKGGIKPAATDTINGKEDETSIISSNPSVTESTVPPVTDMNGEEINLISIQGYMGTDSYLAFKEWQNFLETYDPDKSILYANNHTFQCPEAYTSYHCYSQDLVDKIDEICEKYNLQPLGKNWYFTRGKDVFDAVGIESIFSRSEETGYLDFSGYCYKDGTFSVEGQLELTGEWSSMVRFDYRSVRKTSFDGVARNIGDVSKYDQWNCTMKDGTNVLLALREEGALIIVDKTDSFVTIGVSGTVLHGNPIKFPMEREFLETLCEAFDFTFETSPVDVAKAEELYQAQLERAARGESDRAEYQINYDYPNTYAGFIDYMVNEQKYTGLHYALIDVTGDGVEDLLKLCEKYAVDSPFLFPEDLTTDQPERQVMAEIIREKLLWCLDREIPHGTAVEVTKFTERDNGIIDLDATIYCEKASHKGIIIGKQGAMLKKISTMARNDCERFMGTKVFLTTWVKVKENWRDSDFLVRNFGYSE